MLSSWRTTRGESRPIDESVYEPSVSDDTGCPASSERLSAVIVPVIVAFVAVRSPPIVTRKGALAGVA